MTRHDMVKIILWKLNLKKEAFNISNYLII